LEKHGLEHFKAFTLVFQLGVALAVAAQADAVAQGIHGQQVLLPVPVQGIEQEVARDLPVVVAGRGGQGFLTPQGGGQDCFLLFGRPGRDLRAQVEQILDLGLGHFQAFGLGFALGRFQAGEDFVHDLPDGFLGKDLGLGGLHEFPAARVDDLALLVHDVVVFEQLLSDFEVVGFDPLLGVFNGLGHHAVLDGLAVFHAELVHEAFQAVRAKKTHEIVVEGKVEARGTGIALTTRTAAQLVVDAAGFVAFGAENMQAAEVGDARAEHDIRPTSGHVGGNGHPARLAGLGHDFGFFFVVLGVQDVMGNAGFFEQAREEFRLFDGHRTDENGLAFFVKFLDVSGDGREFLVLRLVDQIRIVLADHGPMGGDGNDFQVVNLPEFHGFGIGRAGHAGQLVVHAEVVLEGDGRKRLVFGFDLDAFLGFQGLVQPIGVPPAGHEAAGEFVHDDDFAVLHHIVHIALEDVMGFQGLEHVVLERDVGRIVEVVDFEHFFHAGHTVVG